MANSTISAPAVQYVDIAGTSGSSGALSITNLSGLTVVNSMILGVFDLDATISESKHLEIYSSGNSWGAGLVDRSGNLLGNTAFNLRLYYARK